MYVPIAADVALARLARHRCRLRIFRTPETKRPGMGRDESLFRMFLPALGTAGRKVGDAYFYL
jgi:hypothetical protein